MNVMGVRCIKMNNKIKFDDIEDSIVLIGSQLESIKRKVKELRGVYSEK